MRPILGKDAKEKEEVLHLEKHLCSAFLRGKGV